MNRLTTLRLDNNQIKFGMNPFVVLTATSLSERFVAEQLRPVPNIVGEMTQLKDLSLAENFLPGDLTKGSLDKRLAALRLQKVPDQYQPDVGEKKRKTDGEMIFQLILENPELCKSFEEFIKKEFAGENLMFWLEVTAFRLRYNSDIALKTRELLNDAYKIYDKFLAPDCPFYINIPAKINDPIQESFKDSDGMSRFVNQWIFNQAHDSIFQLMYGDTFEQRFRWCPQGEEVIDKATATLSDMKSSGSIVTKAWMFN